MRSKGVLVAVVGLGWALAGCASFSTRPYGTSSGAACYPFSREDGTPADLPLDKDCLRNGITYFDLKPALVTYVLTTATGSNGSQVACRRHCVQEYKLLPDPGRRMVLEHHPGLFGASALNVVFRENGTLASIGVESTGLPADVATAVLKAALPAPAAGASRDSSAEVKCTATPSLVSVVPLASLAEIKAIEPGGTGTPCCCKEANPCP
jgi:hypothetical protein